ncbi:NAD(P)H-dependent glycerol-3-phosphate dehydrogenase [Puniceibacterium sp. IMCC21224]|uniref:NAD(P)H-dependent glycerol-3-phosphate dehydrogenase n=1 Tax=Puniceibacterium sp. IMCC21224 TaxID=1618204 RepID=UPI00064DC1E8|nr:NAD(P)H-dependent glycerol-3-phosphate dehydrogenase [Puniceibacterium sp. IMCC21224]KMK65275.1 glycerol-3-phosphate dehydrogenase [Puniceibacterium sp. IMCC21224]
MSIGILGAGAFGTALGCVLARHGGVVTLWGRDAARLAAMQQTRQTDRLPRVTLPSNLTFSTEFAALFDADTLLLATPAQSLPGLLQQIPGPLSGVPLVACCKGLDLTTWDGPAQTIARLKPEAIPALLTGPSFAADIARGQPTALTLACADAAMGRALQQQLSTRTLRLYRTTDVIGAELGGALKNVIAIACGTCIGAGLGDSARAALMTRGFSELQRLAAMLGALPDTLSGLSGLGDLALTCTSDLSRNYRFGLALGRNDPFDHSQTVEGAATARAVTQLAAARGLDLPICATVAAIVDGETSIPEALTALLSRPLKEE